MARMSDQVTPQKAQVSRATEGAESSENLTQMLNESAKAVRDVGEDALAPSPNEHAIQYQPTLAAGAGHVTARHGTVGRGTAECAADGEHEIAGGLLHGNRRRRSDSRARVRSASIRRP